jgi:polysaccharide export outer membrane protein
MANKLIAIILSLVVPAFFTGCASPGPKTETAAPELKQENQAMATEFVLGVGDSVDVSVYRHEDLKTSTKINPTGKIMFPLIGEVQAAGRSITDFQAEVKGRFAKYFVDPQVTVSVPTVQSHKILVLGEVRNPGVFSLDTDLTIMDAVARAGGWSSDAKRSNVLLLRNVSGKVQTESFDMDAALSAGNLSRIQRLQKNDVVYVPTKKIADIAKFMGYISGILSPIVMAEGAIVLWPQMIDAIKGESTSGTIAIPTN